jgi:spermidine synthase
MLDEFKKGWYTELCPLWPGRALSMRVEEMLLSTRSKYQFIEIFRAEGFGLTMALDGKIQCSVSDEFMYHEMLCHVPAFCHGNPRSALVVGGGDGGCARELAKHESLTRIDVCELDEAVVEAAKKHLPSLARGFDDPRVEVHYEDGAKFIKNAPAGYDLVLVDAPDPVGPGEALFAESFLRDAKAALRPGGVLAAQAESFILHPEYTKRVAKMFSRVFAHWGYCLFPIPSYPGGTLGICVGSDALEPSAPIREPDAAFKTLLRCYSPEYHRASFTHPASWTPELGSR